MSNTYWAQFFVEEHTGLEVGFPTHAHQKHVLALQINQAGRPAPLAAACLLVLASLLPCAMPRAKSPPCLAAAAVRVLLLRAWVARSAPHQSWHRPLLCSSADAYLVAAPRRSRLSAPRPTHTRTEKGTKQIQNEPAN